MADVKMVVEAIRRLMTQRDASADRMMDMRRLLLIYGYDVELTDEQRKHICAVEAKAEKRAARHRRAITRLKTRLLQATPGPVLGDQEEDWRIMSWMGTMLNEE